jgi:hypothetical protein
MNLLKIEAQIDVLNLSHVTALHEFLTVLGGHELTQNFNAVIPEVSLPTPVKATRKKAEKVDPSFYDLNTSDAPKTNLPEEETFATVETITESLQVESIEVVEAETVIAPTLMQIRSLVSQKALDNKEAIKGKLIELGAQNVSTLDPKHFQTIFNFLNEL